jgi:hypothetical protein
MQGWPRRTKIGQSCNTMGRRGRLAYEATYLIALLTAFGGIQQTVPGRRHTAVKKATARS